MPIRTIVVPEVKTYDPVGRCIYCDRPEAETPLHKEHIIPKALDSQLVLRKASCTDCADKFRDGFEEYFLRNMVLDARAFLDMKGRSRRRDKGPTPKERPKRIATFNEDGSFGKDTYVDRRTEPFCFFAFEFAPPSAVDGRPLSKDFTLKDTGRMYFDPNRLEAYSKFPVPIMFDFSFSPDKLSLQIAKIAYGAAVAELGYGSFESPIPSLLSGNDPYISHWVGGGFSVDAQPNAEHIIEICIVENFLAVFVRLFNRLEAPTYTVVVGKFNDAQLNKLEKRSFS